MLFIQLFTIALFNFYGNRIALFLSYLFGVIGFLYIYLYFKNERKVIVTTAFAIVSLMLINYISTGQFSLNKIPVEIFSYLSCSLFLFTGKISRKLSFFYFLIIAAVIFFFIRDYDFASTDALFFNSSINYVSVYLIVSVLPYYIACSDENHSVSYIPAVICLVLSLTSLGRGNIILGFTFFAFTIANKLLSSNKYKKKIGTKVISISLLAMTTYLLFYTDFISQYFYRFEVLGNIDESRFYIWALYFQEAISDYYSLFFGVDLRNTPIFKEFLHCHNSFLMMHCAMGLIGLTMFLFLLIKGLVLLLKNRKYDIVIIILSLTIKAFTDWIFPMQISDIVYLYVLLYPFFNIKTRHYHV